MYGGEQGVFGERLSGGAVPLPVKRGGDARLSS